MSYHALARKYRPSTFAEMVGQEHVTRTLRAALRHDRLSHAYLFSGPRGCGKTTVARLLAKALNCAVGEQDEPCGTCDSCKGIAAGTWLDVLEIDAASHTGVDNIRELRDLAQYSPTQGQNRVFIIDEVHMLSKGAFNALLKILEEPPARVFFFFATTEPNRIPRTILSRCQRFDFRLLTREELTSRLREIVEAEGLSVEDDAMRLVVAQAEGSMRDAQSLLDQVLAACEGAVTEQAVVELLGLIQSDLFFDLNEAILNHDAAVALGIADRVTAAGLNLDDFSRQITADIRNLLLLRIDPGLSGGISLPAEQIETLKGQAERFAVQDLLALLDRAASGFERIHRSTQPRVLLEALLVEMVLMESRVLLSDLVHRLEALAGGAPAPGGGGAPRPASPAGGASRAREGGPAVRAAARVDDGDPAASLPVVNAGGAVFAKAAAVDLPGWEPFLSAMLGTHPGVGACLMEGVPRRSDDCIVLAYPAAKEFQVNRIKGDMDLIAERAREHLGLPLVLELVDGDDEAREEYTNARRKSVAPTQNEEMAKARSADPALDDLANLIDGELVPDAEREDWHGRPGAPDKT